jgi:hypothetical protein
MTDPHETTPHRIQRKRAKGWRMPEGAVYVGRGSVFGNPFSVARPEWTPEAVVALYRELKVPELMLRQPLAIPSLRGKTLACWCPEGQACHADVLLEIANA